MKKLILGIAMGLASFGTVAETELDGLAKTMVDACKQSGATDIKLCVTNIKFFITIAYKSGYRVRGCEEAKSRDDVCVPNVDSDELVNEFKDIAESTPYYL
ncbi:hypothetical protein [Budvicia aquatica]|uniref:Uncharacterized protein n=1 Tax=Budvicia aquatica TaxID=82979 RepID=A0A2C6CUN6_9GAMM|nr:hypothetical protein [Budvicia aquatica]PHI30369.1 hypothetical protein CRN84_14005 [Budvicia aquatica]VFS49491.1 Uncharacterised protein [Budvicia aquatica]